MPTFDGKLDHQKTRLATMLLRIHNTTLKLFWSLWESFERIWLCNACWLVLEQINSCLGQYLIDHCFLSYLPPSHPLPPPPLRNFGLQHDPFYSLFSSCSPLWCLSTIRGRSDWSKFSTTLLINDTKCLTPKEFSSRAWQRRYFDSLQSKIVHETSDPCVYPTSERLLCNNIWTGFSLRQTGRYTRQPLHSNFNRLVSSLGLYSG